MTSTRSLDASDDADGRVTNAGRGVTNAGRGVTNAGRRTGNADPDRPPVVSYDVAPELYDP